MKDHSAPVWLTVDEVAAYLGISRMAVYQRIRRGQILTGHLGRSIRIDRRTLDATISLARPTRRRLRAVA